MEESRPYIITTLSITLRDLTHQREEKEAELKRKEIETYNYKKPANSIKALEVQNKVLNKQLERDRKREIDNLKKEIEDLSKEIKENKISHNKEMKEIKDNHDKEMTEIEDRIMREIDEIKDSHKKEIIKNQGNKKFLKEDVSLLQKENVLMTKELEDSAEIAKSFEKNHYQVCLGIICLNLQINMYWYVLPGQFAEDCQYKVKDIEEDIEDEDMLNDTEREEAKLRWEELQKMINWDPSLIETIKLLQKERSYVDHPEFLSVDEARRAVEELQKQDRLKGRTSKERVQKVIEMWSKSISLVPRDQYKDYTSCNKQ
jgi:hypothetical protein